jgi:3-phenylpropionate/trans-cinnamate dioxygenase ferredoxin reductase subunit
MTSSGVVIVGAGHAGGAVAAQLRQYGFAGSIQLIGDEPIAPYQRPPLSKAWLNGVAEREDLLLKAPDWYAMADIDLRLGTRVVALDRAAQTVRLSDGSTSTYHHLILACGARARRLPIPGEDLAHVGVLRTQADADWLKGRLVAGSSLAVIGGGYVGLETASSARALGVTVTVIEREPRLLARVASEALSRFFLDRHLSHGVRFELAAEAASIDRQCVRLRDGRRVDADTVLIGVGAAAEDTLARGSGLGCRDGVIVDGDARTSDPAIFAIGDMTYRPSPILDCHGRFESVPSVLEQSKQAAAAITGRSRPAPEVPWFWSDQYDLKLQIAGLGDGCDAIIQRGDAADDRFAVFHLRAGTLRCVEAVNAPAEFMAGRQLIATGVRIDVACLRDPAISMKQVVSGSPPGR